jgi:hypothetical protein
MIRICATVIVIHGLKQGIFVRFFVIHGLKQGIFVRFFVIHGLKQGIFVRFFVIHGLKQGIFVTFSLHIISLWKRILKSGRLGVSHIKEITFTVSSFFSSIFSIVSHIFIFHKTWIHLLSTQY